MRFELADMPDTKIDGYLPMSWLKNHNPDIDWEKSSLKWGPDYCKTNCLITKRRIEFISSEDLLAENVNIIHFLDSVTYTGEDGKDISLSLLPEYKDYANIFSQEKITSLSQYSEFNHCIELDPGAKPPSGPIYPLTQKELDVLYDYIKEMEGEGRIRRSSFPAGAPILFVPKPDGTPRLYIDY